LLLLLLMVVLAAESGGKCMFLTCFPNGGCLCSSSSDHEVALGWLLLSGGRVMLLVLWRQSARGWRWICRWVKGIRVCFVMFLCVCLFFFFFWVFFFPFLSRNCLCWFFSRIFFSHEGKKEGRKRQDWLA
jgi:hypothetical protein